MHYLFTLPKEWCHDDAETSAINFNSAKQLVKFVVLWILTSGLNAPQYNDNLYYSYFTFS